MIFLLREGRERGGRGLNMRRRWNNNDNDSCCVWKDNNNNSDELYFHNKDILRAEEEEEVAEVSASVLREWISEAKEPFSPLFVNLMEAAARDVPRMRKEPPVQFDQRMRRAYMTKACLS